MGVRCGPRFIRDITRRPDVAKILKTSKGQGWLDSCCRLVPRARGQKSSGKELAVVPSGLRR